MEEYVVVSFSGGKDSTAMLLRMLELEEQINEVVFCDTYKEFPQMLEHIEKVKKVVEEHGIKFTTLRSERSFDYYMFEYEPKRKNEAYIGLKGFSWAGNRARWCTSRMKIQVINRYFNELSKSKKVIHCVGIATDETERIERENNKSKRLPLVEWGWTEADCLSYCYALEYDWGGLYELFNRVSCWCCPLQPLEELRKLRKHYPELWEELAEMDKKTWRKFRADYSVEELEKRFAFEEQRLAEGKSIKNREFFAELRKLLER